MSFNLPELPDEWIFAPLESCAQKGSISYGVVQPGMAVADGVPIIRVNNFKDSRIDLTDVMRITSEIESKYARTRLAGGEILLTLVGSVGQVAVVPKAMAGFNVARAVAVIHPLPHINPEWIALCLRSPLSQNLLGSRANTTVQTTINLKDVRALPIPIPPEKERHQITELLVTLDDRIALLRETNTTLEALAQALFKSWFVDFDPVRAKQQGCEPEGMDAATAALFPDSFEESELGLVPRGWKIVKSGDAIDIRDGTHESPKQAVFGYPFITTRHISTGKIDFENSYLISEDDYKNFSRRSKVDRLDVLTSMIGTVGVPVIVLKNEANFAVKNIGILKTSFLKKLSHYMYLLLKSTTIQQQIESRLAGTTQKYLSLSALRDIKFVLPSESILEHFSQIVTRVFDRIHQNDDTIQTLATLRDTLLPRLISGQLRLPEAASLLEKAAA